MAEVTSVSGERVCLKDYRLEGEHEKEEVCVDCVIS